MAEWIWNYLSQGHVVPGQQQQQPPGWLSAGDPPTAAAAAANGAAGQPSVPGSAGSGSGTGVQKMLRLNTVIVTGELC
jgi:hypothetical protein